MSTKTEDIAPTKLKQLKLLSYNIDGLNDSQYELQERIMYILGIIVSQNPEIIHLQEVVPEAVPHLHNSLQKNGYVCSLNVANPLEIRSLGGYFTLSFVKKGLPGFTNLAFQRSSYQTTEAMSLQGRYIQKTSFEIDNLKYLFINCHLESCGTAFQSAESGKRQAQLRIILDMLNSCKSEGPGIVAGDTNLRDPEAKHVLKDYASISDIAEAAAVASKNKPQSTWVCPGKPFVKCRFDRFYFNNHPSLKVKDVILLGQDIVLSEDTRCGYQTPSDHYGVLATFDLRSDSAEEILEKNEEAKSEASKDSKGRKRAEIDEKKIDEEEGERPQPRKRAKKDSKPSGDVIDLT